ncbi:prion-inhibition and propagation-domain-containing protein, partial [Lasiosphaeria ovina]
MADVAGLVVGVLGIAGLFSSCVENFDIVVKARGFGEDYDLLCTQLSLQRVRFILWGETLGIVPGSSTPYNDRLNDDNIRPAIESTLHHLRSLCQKADLVTGRYDLQDSVAAQALEDAQPASSVGLIIFRERFESFRARIRRNQKTKSTWTVTRWAVHDLPKFRAIITSIRELIDGLEGVTSALGVLEQQQALLVHEVESISDRQSLRLLQGLRSLSSKGSNVSAPTSTVSEIASIRLSILAHPGPSTEYVKSSVTKSSLSYHTAATSRPVENDIFDDGSMERDLPQNQRLMSEILSKSTTALPRLRFDSGSSGYGSSMASVKAADEGVWASQSTRLLVDAHNGVAVARRVFLELRTIRNAKVPFISAAPLDDNLDKLVASIEGPPDTPYAGGIFWILVTFPLTNITEAPDLRFLTKIYHPNIDCKGNICADYQLWWNDPSLQPYMKNCAADNDTKSAWFSERKSNRYSLGALLTALCALLASPNIQDPLVPEIAETYVRNFQDYHKTARLYTQLYARGERPQGD